MHALRGADRVPPKEEVSERLAKEEREEDVSVVVHAEEHTVGEGARQREPRGARAAMSRPMSGATYTRKAAVNCDP